MTDMEQNSHEGEETDNDGHDNEDDSFKQYYGNWILALEQYVSCEAFKWIQFVSNEEDSAYGSDLQFVVCTKIKVPKDHQLNFWVTMGRRAAEAVIRKKRASLTTNARRRFKSK